VALQAIEAREQAAELAPQLRHACIPSPAPGELPSPPAEEVGADHGDPEGAPMPLMEIVGLTVAPNDWSGTLPSALAQRGSHPHSPRATTEHLSQLT